VGPARYYADGGEEPGRWRGRGTQGLGLASEVREADLARVLAGRDPATGVRLVSARGSAGRRPRLGVGAETRRSTVGLALYDPTDAAAVFGLPAKQIHTMLDVGTTDALSRLFPAADGLAAQPEGSYLAPIIDPAGDRWVTETELSRCEAALQAGTAPDEIAALGPPDELLPIGEAALLAGVTPRYLRRLAQRFRVLCQHHPAHTPSSPPHTGCATRMTGRLPTPYAPATSPRRSTFSTPPDTCTASTTSSTSIAKPSAAGGPPTKPASYTT
jgi:TrwC relaxase